MDIKAINLARAKMYHFLSTMYRDELPLHLIEQMQEPVVAIRAALNRAGMRKTPDYSGGDQPPQVWRQLPKVSSIAASPS